jgi:hypothetical protein
VQFYSEGQLEGNFTLTVFVPSPYEDYAVISATTDILSISSTAAEVEAALQELEIISEVSVNKTSRNSEICIFSITFLGMNADLPLIRVTDDNVEGNGLQVSVIEVRKGSAASHIFGSPFNLYVTPALTDSSFSLAYGKGLKLGVTGTESYFLIQAKDSYGNDRTDSQTRDYFKVHAFIPDEDFTKANVVADGAVTYLSGGLYEAVYTPILSGKYTVTVMHGHTLEIQNISTSWPVGARLSGYFVLTLQECGYYNTCPKTKPLAWNADGNDMKTALENIGLESVDVLYTQTSDRLNSAWVITFRSPCDVPSLRIVQEESTEVPLTITTVREGMCSLVGMTNDSTLGFPFVNPIISEEQQMITLVCDNTSTGCKFSLQFRGFETTLLSTLFTASQIQAALENLDTIGAVNLIITYPFGYPGNTTVINVTFKVSVLI